jgi:RNA polymerase primary sigma factor
MGRRGKNTKIKQLIPSKKARRGMAYVTKNGFLPHDSVSSNQIDDIIMLLNTGNVDITDEQDTGKDDLLSGRGGGKNQLQNEKMRTLYGEEDGKTDDPVRMYLREMGSIPLLSRTGEIEIAKKIEEGRNQVIEAIIDTPITAREICLLVEKMKTDQIDLKDFLALEEMDEDNISNSRA